MAVTYDHKITLIAHGWGEDGIGQRIPTPIRSTVLCKVKSVGRAEFYGAATSGLKPEIVFVIHEVEYGGEREVEFDGRRYKVLRTYRGAMTSHGSKLAFDEMEIVCERMVVGGGDGDQKGKS